MSIDLTAGNARTGITTWHATYSGWGLVEGALRSLGVSVKGMGAEGWIAGPTAQKWGSAIKRGIADQKLAVKQTHDSYYARGTAERIVPAGRPRCIRHTDP